MHEHTHDEGLTTEDQEYARDRELLSRENPAQFVAHDMVVLIWNRPSFTEVPKYG